MEHGQLEKNGSRGRERGQGSTTKDNEDAVIFNAISALYLYCCKSDSCSVDPVGTKLSFVIDLHVKCAPFKAEITDTRADVMFPFL